MEDYYAARAKEYDQVYLKPERQSDLRELEQWLSQCLKNRQVLEVACGTAYWTQFIADACHHIKALDASNETLKIARERVKATNVDFIHGDAYALSQSVSNEAFDAALAGFWFSHIPIAQRQAFLAQLHDCLLPGSKIIFIDNYYVEGSSSPISRVDGDGNSYQKRFLADGSEYEILKNFPEKDDLMNLLSPYSKSIEYQEWQYFWAVEYIIK